MRRTYVGSRFGQGISRELAPRWRARAVSARFNPRVCWAVRAWFPRRGWKTMCGAELEVVFGIEIGRKSPSRIQTEEEERGAVGWG